MLNIPNSQMNILTMATGGFVAIMGELSLPSGTIRISSLPYNFTDNNSVLWVGASGVVSYGAAPSATSLIGAPLTVIWSGASSALISAARDAEILNSEFKQFMYFFDISGNQVSNPLLLFSGFCETPEINPDPENPTITLTVESDSITLNRPNEYRMTPERIRRDHADDTFFDYVASLVDKEIKAQ